MKVAPQRPRRSMSVAVEDYVKAIYKLQSEAAVATVSTNDLARHLGVTAASASEMLRKLDDLGLVTYVRYRGVCLTEAGQRSALAVVRRHRLLELYLAVALGLSWDQVHDEAERLEHALSPELEAVIAAKLGNPARDPHGDPIPTSDGRVAELPARSLSALRAGERGILVRVSDADSEILRQLTRLGIALGQEVEVLAEREAAGTLAVRVAGVTHALAASVVAAMRVEVDDEA